MKNWKDLLKQTSSSTSANKESAIISTITPSTLVTNVVMDSCAFLKIVQHCRTEFPRKVSGYLLGSENNGIITITDAIVCSKEHLHDYVKLFAKLGADGNLLGCYASSFVGMDDITMETEGILLIVDYKQLTLQATTKSGQILPISQRNSRQTNAYLQTMPDMSPSTNIRHLLQKSIESILSSSPPSSSQISCFSQLSTLYASELELLSAFSQ